MQWNTSGWMRKISFVPASPTVFVGFVAQGAKSSQYDGTAKFNLRRLPVSIQEFSTIEGILILGI